MFIGHFAVAMAAKRAAPHTSLGLLFGAAQLADLLWPPLLLAGVERASVRPGDTAFTPLAFEHYPWSHSLLMLTVWGALLGGVYAWRRGDRRAALVLAALVASHWLLDWVTHRPDMPLVPGAGPKLGLGLWNNVAATLAVEGVLFAVCVWVYSQATVPRDRAGRWGWIALVAFLALLQAANVVSPPPPNMTAVAVGGLLLWLPVLWGAWIDRHRSSASAAAAINAPGSSAR